MKVTSRLCLCLPLISIAAAGFASTACTVIGWDNPQQLRKAAEGGSAKSQSRLGTMYFDGRDVPQDYLEAARWWRQAADQGVAKAQYNLGTLYAEGQGVTQNYQTAAYWFRKAAEQEDAAAHNNLGFLYYRGRGVPQDYEEAARLYRVAAEQGIPPAQYHLGIMYHQGQGVPQDPIQAHAWLNVATANGHPKAQQERDQLAEALSPEQLREAQQLARKINRANAGAATQRADISRALGSSTLARSQQLLLRTPPAGK